MTITCPADAGIKSHIVLLFSSHYYRSPRRLQNMILAVGLETPASIVKGISMNHSLESSSSDDDDDDGDSLSSNEGEHSTARVRVAASASDHKFSVKGNKIEESGLDSKTKGGDRYSKRAGWVIHDKDHSMREAECENENRAEKDKLMTSGRKRSSSSSSSQVSDGYIDSISSRNSNQQNSRSGEIIEQNHTGSLSDDSSVAHRPPNYQLDTSYCASISHSGCINTAAWLNCPWRLSLAQTGDNSDIDNFVISSSQSSNAATSSYKHNSGKYARAIPSEEFPTQLLTSSDDRLVKFWDVRNSIGSVSPIECSATVCPFSADIQNTNPSDVMEWRRQWKRGRKLPGTVTHLATVNTGHSCNVFHVTPIPNRPGKIASCAADGCLHLSDIEMQSTSSPAVISPTIIISPEYDDTNPRFETWGSRKMCFSHHFMDSNTGLLCSQKGLQLFDLRLSPQSQSSRNLLNGVSEGCKSCAIFSKNETTLDDIGVDSAYVFGTYYL